MKKEQLIINKLHIRTGDQSEGHADITKPRISTLGKSLSHKGLRAVWGIRV